MENTFLRFLISIPGTKPTGSFSRNSGADTPDLTPFSILWKSFTSTCEFNECITIILLTGLMISELAYDNNKNYWEDSICDIKGSLCQNCCEKEFVEQQSKCSLYHGIVNNIINRINKRQRR